MKRDIVTAVIYCYITTDFHYAKCDSHLSAYGGVMLQRVCIKKNVNRHFSLNFAKFCNKITDLNALLSFLKLSRVSARSKIFSDLTLSEFPLLRRVKATYSILKSLLLEAEKRHLKHPAAPIPPQNHSTGLSAPFQLNSKSNSSPQLKLQSSGDLVC